MATFWIPIASTSRINATVTHCAALGWQALGPFLLNVLGHDDLDERRVADALRPALVAFLTAEPSAPVSG